MRNKRISPIGKKFNSLTIVRYLSRNEGYLCKCDCGNFTKSKLHTLSRGRHKSCGCYKRNLKPDHYAAKRNVLKNYRRSARKRGYEFALSEEQFFNLIIKSCFYCNRIPLLKSPLKRHEDFRYNGIDRIDSNSGYTIDNCVTCCKICNFAKLNFPIEEFQDWLKALRNSERILKTGTGDKIMQYNLLLDVDSYKMSHWLQFPPKTTNMFYYLESRGGKYRETLFFGLQYILKEYLSKPITRENIEEAKEFAKLHGEPFNYDDWIYILEKYNGYLPLKIKAVKEGTIVPTHNVLMTVESTDHRCFWIPSYVETLLMRIWYGITVATQSWHIKQIIKGYLDRTSDNPEAEINFKLHDFGARGVSSMESSGIGCMSHLVNFMGSDTVMGVAFANRYYDSKMAAFSIPAAEHSTITSWGRENEVEAYRNMLKQFASKDKLVAVVSDSYDLSNAVLNLWGKELKQEVIDSGATVVIRPDSGHPATVVLRTLKELESKFDSSYNKKGFRVLNYVRVIQGDGINEESIREILETITRDGFSATNVAFGMGGALLQKIDRDTQKFAYKCSEVTVDGKNTPVFKCPADDKGKTSKKGRLDLVIKNGKYETVQGPTYGSVLETVFEDGKILKTYTLDEIRATSKG